jgi:hypothetical protein
MANNPKLQGSAPVQGAVRQPAAQLQGSGPIQGAARSPTLSPLPAAAFTQAPKPTAAPAAASWKATDYQPNKPPTSPITAQPGYRPSAKPPAPAAPTPAWQAPPDQGYQKDRAAELYQKGMDSTMANQQANRDAARMNAAWKSAPKVGPKTLVNPSGAKIPGIAAPDQQTGPGPKISRLTGKPMQVGYVGGGGVATPKSAVAAVPKPSVPKPPVPVAPAVKQPSVPAGSAVMSQRAGFTPKPVIGAFPAKGANWRDQPTFTATTAKAAPAVAKKSAAVAPAPVPVRAAAGPAGNAGSPGPVSADPRPSAWKERASLSAPGKSVADSNRAQDLAARNTKTKATLADAKRRAAQADSVPEFLHGTGAGWLLRKLQTPIL